MLLKIPEFQQFSKVSPSDLHLPGSSPVFLFAVAAGANLLAFGFQEQDHAELIRQEISLPRNGQSQRMWRKFVHSIPSDLSSHLSNPCKANPTEILLLWELRYLDTLQIWAHCLKVTHDQTIKKSALRHSKVIFFFLLIVYLLLEWYSKIIHSLLIGFSK